MEIIKARWLIILLVLLCHVSKAQYTSADVSAMENSPRYHYNGNDYIGHIPNWQPSGGAMEIMQGRYNYNFEILKNEYKKLKSLTLVNEQNKQLVDSYQVSSDYENKSRQFSQYDITKSNNFNYWYQLYTTPFAYESVRNELLLLQNLQLEIAAIMYANRSNFADNKRYQTLVKVFAELKLCNKDEIGALRFKYGLL